MRVDPTQARILTRVPRIPMRALAGVADSGDPWRPLVATRPARNPYGRGLWPISPADKETRETW